MDEKDELIRLTEPHLNWFYGPFSSDKPPPMMPKAGDWIVTVQVNVNGDMRYNVGQFMDIGVQNQGFYYSLASCAPFDNWEFVAAYALMPKWHAGTGPFGLRAHQNKVTCEIWQWKHYPALRST